MARVWSGKDWKVEIEGSSVSLKGRASSLTLFGDGAADIELERSWFRWFADVGGKRTLRLRGMRRAEADTLRIELRRVTLADDIATAVAWDHKVRAEVEMGSREQRWVPRERVDALVELQPRGDLPTIVREAEIEPLLSADERRALAAARLDVPKTFSDLNEQTLRAELRDRRDFFDKIEKSPLTEEQARAVVCFDSRVHLLAAAGSGKTSVMVARAAYAVARGFVAPERVLLLAFNRAAAQELQKRVEERFAAAGISSDGVKASTFHAFGLDVIGRATGRKPRLAPWLDSGQDVKRVEQSVDQLRDSDSAFRYKWDLFRLMFASAPTELDGGTPDAYDIDTKMSGYRTFRGEIVRSVGERMIADWLFMNGVNYEYERPFHLDTATAEHSQYHPDFYYPDVDVWHEHWGIDRDGQPRADMDGYLEDMEWKKKLHEQHQTQFIQTTWHDVMYGEGFQRLERELTELGVKFNWNPDREIPSGVKPLQFGDLARLMRTFMTHVKSNSLDQSAIELRLAGNRRVLSGFRTRLFLDLYWAIHREWDRELGNQNYVDFEDMLVLAADHLEAGNVDPGYELVLVDEFQDVSQARARLVRGLLQQPGRFLMAVGDDWQAINRFAGADISVMMNFDEWFGASTQLELATTFRCPQTICDVGSQFVMRNRRQFQKAVCSAHTDPGPPVMLMRVGDAKVGVARALEEISRSVERGEGGSGHGGRATVNVLGRYGFDSEVMPLEPPANLDVSFRTVHGSKGLEADYIVVPRLVSGRYAFPSEIADDPVLDLAMAAPDDFPNAEERRLFYVALTRAKHQVMLVTERGKESAFVVELLRAGMVAQAGEEDPQEPPAQACSKCGKGMMVRRRGPYGEFLGCSRFPACTHKDKITGIVPESLLGPPPLPPRAQRDPFEEESPVLPPAAGIEEAECRFCANSPPRLATVCRYCGRDLSPPENPIGEGEGLVAGESVDPLMDRNTDDATARVGAPKRTHKRGRLWLLAGILAVTWLGVRYVQDPSALVSFGTLADAWRVLQTTVGAEPAGTRMYVDTAVLNVRRAPGVDSPIVAQLHSGDAVWQVGESGSWRHISLVGGKEALGWVYAPLISDSPPRSE